MQTVIEQHSEKLLLKAEKTEVTAVQNNLNQTNNNLSALTTRVSKAEVELRPDNIWIGISSKVTSVSKITNIVPDSCFDDANYSLLYAGGSRVSAATANNSCPTSYCMKSTHRDVQAKNYVAVAEGEKYYVSAYVNAQLANHIVRVGLILKNPTVLQTGIIMVLLLQLKLADGKNYQVILQFPLDIQKPVFGFKLMGGQTLVRHTSPKFMPTK